MLRHVASNTEVFVDEYFGDLVIKQSKSPDDAQSVAFSIYDVPTLICALRNLLIPGRDITRALEADVDSSLKQSLWAAERLEQFEPDDDLPF
jgi:hypothetical protein